MVFSKLAISLITLSEISVFNSPMLIGLKIIGSILRFFIDLTAKEIKLDRVFCSLECRGGK